MGLLSNEGIARRNLSVFFLIDISGSMMGAPIAAVNEAMEKLVPVMKKLDEDNADAEVSFGILTFGTTVSWLTPNGPESVADFEWTDVNVDGLTSLGAAFKDLNSKLSTNAFMKAASASLAPVFILISDGVPSDDYEKSLSDLKQNNWFRSGMKLALAYEDGVDRQILEKFTGTNEAIIDIKNAEDLRKVIQFVTVTSSQIASKSQVAVTEEVSTDDPSGGGADVAAQVTDDDGNIDVDVDDWGEW
ncbi:MAG: VWA domain-containing protein [Lactobacillales bacterium]|jgi:uncharacterized protein YegL|nr:VWA domain-containing protein [Lactobacillales bacterium]